MLKLLLHVKQLQINSTNSVTLTTNIIHLTPKNRKSVTLELIQNTNFLYINIYILFFNALNLPYECITHHCYLKTKSMPKLLSNLQQSRRKFTLPITKIVTKHAHEKIQNNIIKPSQSYWFTKLSCQSQKITFKILSNFQTANFNQTMKNVPDFPNPPKQDPKKYSYTFCVLIKVNNNNLGYPELIQKNLSVSGIHKGARGLVVYFWELGFILRTSS
eukprot:TRINITY_DN17013_c0_g1_i7.p1 TRINITY_DN17013_c0_g1~~TRINITY_DN17013_c0_g1_i7.p1  ORF type:complete len:227 (+),score=-5.74 TRINITY_DN17013_c0_g1_i7:31-681(+)